MNSEENQKFYTNLPLLETFFEVSNPSNFHPLPENWFMAITDIVDSAKAIDKGQYKNVNILGASPIVGILNPDNKNDLPFTFGGDGCTFCFPPSLLDTSQKVLATSRQIGRAEYDLDLRAGIIPVQDIRDAGFDIKVARYKVSEFYNQAIFSGGGLRYGEKLLKKPGNQNYIVLPADRTDETDFTGLECRWKKVKPKGKKIITLLVQANNTLINSEEIYKKVLVRMRDIFGFDDQTNPIDPSGLDINISFPELMGEIKFRTFGMNWFQRFKYVLNLELQNLLGKLFMAMGYRSSATDWAQYKPDLALNSDHRKFDDMLRVVISGSENQFQQLKAFLQDEFETSRLSYGYHISDSAMITCMVFEYHRRHIHFVDGDEGGYFMASKMLKQKTESLQNQ